VLFGFGADWYTLAVMGALILVGGFGITVLYDLWSYPADRSLGLNTRFTLVLTVVLTAIGLGVILSDMSFHRNVVSDLPAGQRVSVGLFTIISARTAGLTILPLVDLGQATQLLIAIWMFIGGSPASMAGGVSTSALAVLLAAVLATARGHRAAITFHRTLPTETVAKAVAIMTVSTLLVVGMTLILALHNQGDIFTVGFEVVSAFANAGYSLDFTTQLDTLGRYLIAFTMFWGRLGPLTIVVALTQTEQPTLIRYPEEPVIMG
jgi:trk system potassium uptake protein TrkH